MEQPDTAGEPAQVCAGGSIIPIRRDSVKRYGLGSLRLTHLESAQGQHRLILGHIANERLALSPGRPVDRHLFDGRAQELLKSTPQSGRNPRAALYFKHMRSRAYVVGGAGDRSPGGHRGLKRGVAHRWTLGPAFFAAALLLIPSGLTAQSSDTTEVSGDDRRFYSSRYLPLENWTYRYLDVLIARGHLTGLSPLVQPYRRIDVAAAILEAERQGRFTPEELRWVELLEREFDREIARLEGNRPQRLTFNGEFDAGFEAVTQEHRDLLRPTSTAHFFPTLALRLYGAAPNVAGALEYKWNDHYLNDPQYPNDRAIPFRQCDPIAAECAYRMEEAYVELQWPYIRLFFGRMYRNWGLPGVKGYLVSDYRLSYDHLGYRIGSERIGLSGIFSTFNDFKADTAHYFSTHRFDWMIRDNLVIAVGESAVWGGPDRRIDLALLNPVSAWEVTSSGAANLLGMAELWWRPYSNLITHGVFMVDNTSVGDEEQGKQSGLTQYAAGLGVQMPMVTPTLGLRADFSVVNALAYRSRVAFWEYYTIGQAGWGIGLAHDRVDAIHISLLADWWAHPRVLLSPNLQLLWKGEDDLTDPFPDGAFTGRDKLLVGIVETTIRPALGGQWRYPLGDVRWDVGLNIVKNDDHVVQDWTVEYVGRVEAEIRFQF